VKRKTALNGAVFADAGTPESVVNNADVKAKLADVFCRFPHALIVIDEAHCIPKW
jgi:superfamily II DNA helicase RecQ